ncbi:hypothetical protein AJ80_02292 [Polytolypa hystricis UAMH7299]|uniref:Uncharacterized protein n=1 Tax=Polytolypa hystricis (strain UAMH7299) TaxID=1447883 RepID=A0A2B7YPT5_POLH7|nr:hypothetical protein AJ80_02292 [Polytolypa hystricis UAMH7299]
MTGAAKRQKPTIQSYIEDGVYVQIIQAMLEAGADPYRLSSWKMDSFHIALSCGRREVLSLLRQYASAHPNPSHWLCALGESLGNKADLLDDKTFYQEAMLHAHPVDPQNTDGEPLLFVAASSGNSEVAGKLLACGVDVQVVDLAGRTALHAAVYKNQADVVALLLDAGANPNQAASSWVRYELRLRHATPLQMCVVACHTGAASESTKVIVRSLLDFGADPNDRSISVTGELSPPPLKQLFDMLACHWMTSAYQRIIVNIIELFIDGGATVSGTVDDICLGEVPYFEGRESLWEIIRAELVRTQDNEVKNQGST